MFDVPVDAMYVWIGVGAVSLAALGVVVALPGAAPPDAVHVAQAVDTVAVAPPGATEAVAISAERIRLGPYRVGLAGPGGRAHAAFAYGPVAVADDSPCLDDLLAGEPPRSGFETQRAFELCIRVAQLPFPEWRPAPERLRFRRVSWGDVDVTIAG